MCTSKKIKEQEKDLEEEEGEAPLLTWSANSKLGLLMDVLMVAVGVPVMVGGAARKSTVFSPDLPPYLQRTGAQHRVGLGENKGGPGNVEGRIVHACAPP